MFDAQFSYLCSSVGVRALVFEYSRGIITSEGYNRVTRGAFIGCVSDTNESSE